MSYSSIICYIILCSLLVLPLLFSFYAATSPSSFHFLSSSVLLLFPLIPFICLFFPCQIVLKESVTASHFSSTYCNPFIWPLVALSAHHCCHSSLSFSSFHLPASLYLPLVLPLSSLSPFLSHRPLILPYIHSVSLISCVSVPNLCARSDWAYVKSLKRREVRTVRCCCHHKTLFIPASSRSYHDTHTQHARWDYIKARWWKPSWDAPSE